MDAELVLRRLKARTPFAGRRFYLGRLSAFSYDNFRRVLVRFVLSITRRMKVGDRIYSQGLRLQSGASRRFSGLRKTSDGKSSVPVPGLLWHLGPIALVGLPWVPWMR